MDLRWYIRDQDGSGAVVYIDGARISSAGEDPFARLPANTFKTLAFWRDANNDGADGNEKPSAWQHVRCVPTTGDCATHATPRHAT